MSLPHLGFCLTKRNLDTFYSLLPNIIPDLSTAHFSPGILALVSSFMVAHMFPPQDFSICSSLYLECSSPRSSQYLTASHLSDLYPTLLPPERFSLNIPFKVIPAPIYLYTFPIHSLLSYHKILFSPLHLSLSAHPYLFFVILTQHKVSSKSLLFIFILNAWNNACTHKSP